MGPYIKIGSGGFGLGLYELRTSIEKRRIYGDLP